MILSLHGIVSSSRKSEPFTILVGNSPMEFGSVQFEIPTNGSLTYLYDVYWEQSGDPTTNGLAIGRTGNWTLNFPVMDAQYIVKIYGVFPAIYFNNTGSKDRIYDILQWGDIQWQSMERAFWGCSNLGYSATDVPDLSNVTNFDIMFRECLQFNGDISLWDTSTITSMDQMFRGAYSFNQNIGGWDTSNVLNMQAMFLDATSFGQDLTGWCVFNILSEPSDFATNSSLSPSLRPVWGNCPGSPGPFEFIFARDTNTPPAVEYLVAAGTWSLDNGSITYDQLGKVFFSIDATGDTSSVVEWGIVSSTNSGPTYSSDPLSVNLGNGVVYNVTDETRYYRAYALTNTGQYFYSSSPGVQIPMERFQFTYLQLSGGMFGGPFDITIVCKLFNLNARVPDSYGMIANVVNGAFDPESWDPYYVGGPGNTPATTIGTFGEEGFSILYDDVGYDLSAIMYVRAYVIIGGYRYWSGLLHFYV